MNKQLLFVTIIAMAGEVKIESSKSVEIAPSIKLENTRSISDFDAYRDVIVTPEGEYLVCGGTRKNSDVIAYLIKTDYRGGMKWERTYPYGQIQSVAITKDNYYLLSGQDEEGNIYLIKTDYEGKLVWVRTYGSASDVIILDDGNYLIAGNTNSKGAGNLDAYLIKTDINGQVLWDKTYGGIERDAASAVIGLKNEGHITIGFTESKGYGDQDIYLIKTDVDGNLIWDLTYGSSSRESGIDVKQASDGGYIFVGTSSSDIFLIKTDVDGHLIWEEKFGGNEKELPAGLDITTDGGYIIAGSSSSFGNNFGPYIIKTNINGYLEWEKAFEFGSPESIVTTEDCGFLMAGYDASNPGINFYLLKTDSEGNTN